MTAKTDSTKKKTFDVKVVLKDLLILVLGGVITLMVQQIFFKRNKEFEIKAELSKSLYYEQYQIINRILDFADMYSIENFLDHNQSKTFSYALVEGDTLSKGKYDSLSKFSFSLSQDPMSPKDSIFNVKRRTPIPSRRTTPPSFVTSPEKRKRFLEDFEFIRTNRDKIDFRLYDEFKKVVKIVDAHPFPNTFDPKELLNCSWGDRNLQNKWQGTLTNLYYNACGRLRFDAGHYWLIN
jgi:hypothetical protein